MGWQALLVRVFGRVCQVEAKAIHNGTMACDSTFPRALNSTLVVFRSHGEGHASSLESLHVPHCRLWGISQVALQAANGFNARGTAA